MKKTLFMMLCSMLVWTSCKDGKQGGEAADAVADSLSTTTERIDAAAEETEVSDNVSTIDVEKYWQRFQELYKEGDLDDIHYPLTKYAFIDIDGDGKDEVWVRTENDEDGALFFFDDEEEPQLIITETEGKRLSVAKGWVGNGFPAGGPSYINHYVVLKDSHVEYDFTDFQVYENHEYYLRDTEITEAEAKKIQDEIKRMGEGNAVTPEWQQRASK